MPPQGFAPLTEPNLLLARPGIITQRFLVAVPSTHTYSGTSRKSTPFSERTVAVPSKGDPEQSETDATSPEAVPESGFPEKMSRVVGV